MTVKDTRGKPLKFRFLPLTLSIETLGGVATPLVLRGTPLPATRTKNFSTASHNQTAVTIKVLFGESPLARKNLHLTTFELGEIPPAPKGEAQIAVTFEVDQECQLKVRAIEKKSDSKISVESDQVITHLSRMEIERILEQTEKESIEDQDELKHIEVKNRAEAAIHRAEVYLSTQNELKFRDKDYDKIEQALAALGLALDQQNTSGIRIKVEELEKLLPSENIALDFGDFFKGFESIFGPTIPKKGTHINTGIKKHWEKEIDKRDIADQTGKSQSDDLTVSPKSRYGIGKIFGGGDFALDPKLCLILMPFAEKMKPIYDDHIRPVVISENLSCLRADEVVGTNMITWDIWEKINRARVIVADLTGQNPNVFYEVGLAHALGKDVILLTQSMDYVPFDLKALRCIVYNFTPRGMIEMEKRLRATIKKIMQSS